MLRYTVRVALLFACVAALTGAGTQAYGLLPADADWGTPPPDSWPQMVLDPPPYSGWLYYFKPGCVGNVAAAGEDRLLISDSDQLQWLDPKSGKQLWSKAEEYLMQSVTDGHAFYFQRSGQAAALDLATGKDKWTKSPGEWIPVATARNGVWATRSESPRIPRCRPGTRTSSCWTVLLGCRNSSFPSAHCSA